MKPANRLWSLNTVRIPDGISDARVRFQPVARIWHPEIGGGLGPLKEQDLASWPDGLFVASKQCACCS